MSTETESLSALTRTLRAIPAHEVIAPDMPVARFVQQGVNLDTFLKARPDVVEKLVAIGVDKKRVARLRDAIGALQAAEATWGTVSGRRKAEEQAELEAHAEELRSILVAACRWNLRANRAAQAAIDAIQQGDGVADLALDLETLAALIDGHAAAFDDDTTFDTAREAQGAREVAAALRKGHALGRLDGVRAEALDLRNRAFTFADALVDDLREAARYAFRGQEDVLRHFRDEYELERARRSRRRRRLAAEGVDDEVPAEAPVEG